MAQQQRLSPAEQMRVLHITPAFHPATYWGGPIHSVHGLCNALARLPDVSLRVLTTDTAGPHIADRVNVSEVPVHFPAGYDVYYLRRTFGKAVSPQMLRHLWPMARWADIVHLTATYSFQTIPTLIACRALNKPLVWSPRGALLATHEWPAARRQSLKRVWELLCNAILAKVRCTLHVTSEQESVASHARIPNAACRVIRNGVEAPDSLPARKRSSKGKLAILYLGRLDPKKGIENLLHAVHLLRDSSVWLEICGTGEAGYVRGLHGLAKSLDLASRIRFRGHVDGEAKSNAFVNSDVCVVPSHSENFGMVVAEALAHGVPVIASRGTPWAAVVGKGCGLWVPNDPGSLAEAITQVRGMNLQEMGDRGRAWMLEEFGWDAVGRQMHQLYEHMCARG